MRMGSQSTYLVTQGLNKLKDWSQVRALAESLKDIQRLVLKPLLRWLGCVLRGAVLLEVNLHPSLRSWVLWRRFSSRILLISLYNYSSFPRSWLVSQSLPLKNIPTAWCCHHHDGARFPPNVTLGIQAKEFNLGFIRPDNLVSHCLRVF